MVDDPNDDRNYNTSVVVNSDGEIVSTYHKTHLYDAFGNKESDKIKPGDKFFEPIDTPFGRIGLFVCYEVRFPEVARDQRAKGADIIYTDSYRYHTKPGAEEMHIMQPYKVNNSIMSAASTDAIFMHPLPASRGVEVAPDVIDGKFSVVMEQAENKLHAIKGILALLID